MRKLLYTLAGLGALAMIASCSKEAESTVAESGGLTATFTVLAPEGVVTKAIGDGAQINSLAFAAYDEAGNYLSELSSHATITGSASPWTVTVPVIKDMTYKFVFYAKSTENNGYSVFDASGKTITVDYTKLSANDDKADFFYAYDSFLVESSFSKTETLTRPLAQVNFGASDLTAAAYSIKTDETLLTGVALTGINNVLNVLDQTLSGAEDIEIVKAARVEDESEFVTGYDRVAMVYVLAGASQTSYVTLNVSAQGAQNTTAHTIIRNVANIPLQANYRTNILGNLFTNDFVFTVQTAPGFVGSDMDKLVAPSFDSVSALNTYFETLEGNADNGDIDPETVMLTAIPEDSPVIVLPKTAENILIKIPVAYEGTLTIKYNDTATESQKPANLYLYAASLTKLVANITATHMELMEGSVVTDQADVHTSDGTFVVRPTARVGKLNVMRGNAEVAGEVSEIIVNAGATADGESAHVQVSLSADAQVTTITLFAVSDVVVEQPKGNIDEVPGDASDTRNNVKVMVGADAAGSTATALNNGSIYLVAVGDVTVVTQTDESAEEDDNPTVYVASTGSETTVLADEEGDGQITSADGADVTPTVLPDEDGDYQITSAGKLVRIVEMVYGGETFAGKTLVLTSDIDMTGVAVPASAGDAYVKRSGANLIGPAFNGVFDGNGKTISNLSVTADKNDEDQAVGLFGGLDGAVVKDVTFVGVSINGSGAEQAGVVAGLMTGGSVIENVKVLSGTVSSKNAAGGMAGRILVSGIIRGCENGAAVSTTGYNVGGMTGIGYYDNGAAEYNKGNTRIENCVNRGTITAGSTGAGGIAGLFYGDIVGCTNHAAVTGQGTSIGGILGEAQSGAVIDCTNNGTVTNTAASGYGTGGIVGWIRSSYAPSENFVHAVVPTVSGCTNTANVSGGSDAGGIVGTVYVTANIVGNTSSATLLTASSFAAGIVANYQKTEDFKSLGLTKNTEAWNAAKLYVTDNELLTSPSLTANCTDTFVYDNTQGASVVLSGNKAPVNYTFTQFNAMVVENNGVYEAPEGVDVIVTLSASERSIYNNNTSQFYLGRGTGEQINGIETVSVKGVTFTYNHDEDASGKTLDTGEVYATAMNITVEDCTFINNSGLSSWGYLGNDQNPPQSMIVKNCIFKDLTGRYAVHQNRAKDLTVEGCSFVNCERGIHTNSPTPASIIVKNNTFSGISDSKGVLCFAEGMANISSADVQITGNSAPGQAMLRSLNASASEAQIIAIRDNNEYGTLYVEGSTYKPVE